MSVLTHAPNTLQVADEDVIDPKLREVIAGAAATKSPPQSWYQTMGHIPEVAKAFAGYWDLLHRGGSVPHQIEELARVQIARTIGCEFCAPQTSRLAQDPKAGLEGPMRLFARLLILAIIVSALILTGLLNRVAAQQRALTVIEIYTGSDGQTHDKKIDVKLTPWVDRSTAERSDAVKATSVRFRRFPRAWMNDWHTTPEPQYVITISGRGEIELIGGQKILLEPGRVLLADDLAGKGHIARTVGTEDWISISVPVANQ